jgi:hypothetical protein
MEAKVARARRTSKIFAFRVFTEYPFLNKVRFGEGSFRRAGSDAANKFAGIGFLKNVADRKKVRKWR